MRTAYGGSTSIERFEEIVLNVKKLPEIEIDCDVLLTTNVFVLNVFAASAAIASVGN